MFYYEHMPKPDIKHLIDHMSRLEGQLASIKRELQHTQPNCTKAATTLRAASRSFDSFKRSFVDCFLQNTFPSIRRATSHPSTHAHKAYDILIDLIRT